MKHSGFSLVEMLMVIGIIGVVGGITVPLYRDYQVRNDLNVATEQVTQGLARARLLSQSAQGDAGWGFYIPDGVLFKGDSYATRDESADEIYEMPSTIATSGLTEVSYSKNKGVPGEIGQITLTAQDNEERTILIEVQNQAVSVVSGDNLTICHNPGTTNQHTLTISDNAWPAHQNQGDTLGACAGASSSSAPASSSVASVVSSASSTAAGGGASSAGGNVTLCHYPPGNNGNFGTISVGAGAVAAHQAHHDTFGACVAPTCSTGFAIAGNGDIVTAGSQSVTFTALASYITYGIGGPTIPVTIQYSVNNGKTWTNLFNGKAISGGETQTVTIPDGSQVALSASAYFKKTGWLTYSKTVMTNDWSGYTQLFTNGQTVPNLAGYNGQTGLRTTLSTKGKANASGVLSIGNGGVMMIGELGSCIGANCPSGDFQDAIVQAQFSGVSCP